MKSKVFKPFSYATTTCEILLNFVVSCYTYPQGLKIVFVLQISLLLTIQYLKILTGEERSC